MSWLKEEIFVCSAAKFRISYLKYVAHVAPYPDTHIITKENVSILLLDASRSGVADIDLHHSHSIAA